MMKFPSSVGGGTAPSGNSFAFTYPGVFGSRAGGVGRRAGDVCAVRNAAVVRASRTALALLFVCIGSCLSMITSLQKSSGHRARVEDREGIVQTPVFCP